MSVDWNQYFVFLKKNSTLFMYQVIITFRTKNICGQNVEAKQFIKRSFLYETKLSDNYCIILQAFRELLIQAEGDRLNKSHGKIWEILPKGRVDFF